MFRQAGGGGWRARSAAPLRAANGGRFFSKNMRTSCAYAPQATYSSSTYFSFFTSASTSQPNLRRTIAHDLQTNAVDTVGRPLVISGVSQHGPLVLESLLEEEEDDDGRGT
ncbi:hypothetical protein QOT17_016844 [Balamuthia mandrillaris]